MAAELRSNGNVKPTTFDDATVCFSDFVGFTLSSEKLPAETLINALNEYFTAFDDIVGRYGLEKLKTIGDAYMFAGGLPNLRASQLTGSSLAERRLAARFASTSIYADTIGALWFGRSGRRRSTDNGCSIGLGSK